MTDPADNTSPQDRNQTIILSLYGVFILALIGQIVPVMTLQLVCALLVLVLLAVAGQLRRKNPSGPLHDHAVYLIRTIWIWSLFLMLSLAAMGYYASTVYTYDEMIAIAQGLAAGELISDDARKFGMLGVAAVMPSLLYLLLRLGRGIWHGARGTTLPNPKTLL